MKTWVKILGGCVLSFSFLFMTVGYAALTDTLNISGFAEVEFDPLFTVTYMVGDEVYLVDYHTDPTIDYTVIGSPNGEADFKQWINANGVAVTTIPRNNTNDYTLYASWYNKYTINFIDTDGSLIYSEEFTEGASSISGEGQAIVDQWLKNENQVENRNHIYVTWSNYDMKGAIINFKTYSKSFRNKKRIDNPEENWAVFKDVHEPIIDRETFEMVQKLVAKTKRRAPKKENGEKNMFCGLLYCADCGSPLWFNVNHPNKAIQYFNCSNYRANRGTCPSTHYIRADSIEQVVIAELQTIARFLDEEEEAFATLLETKTNKDIAAEQKLAESSLATARARVKEIERLYERIYEDNVNGKVSDEWFMKLSHKYEVEMEDTKKNILALRETLDSLAEKRQTKENFVKAVRSFMEMKTLNPVILRELIEKIEVYQIEGTGKNRTQRVVIHYRFVGCLQIPEWYRKRKITLESRQGVAVNYLPTTA